MKRPFLIVSVLSLILSFAALYLGKTAVLIFSVFIAVLLLVFFTIKKELFIKMVVPIFFLVLAILNAFYSINVSKKAETLPKEDLTVKGIVTETPTIYENGQSFILKLDFLNTKAFVFSSNLYDVKAGDKVTALVSISPQNSYKAANYSQGIYISSLLREIKEIKTPKISVYKIIANYRSYIEQTLFNKASERNAPILIALSTGNKTYIDPVSQKYINNSGVSHIMAVSGLHLGIISLYLAKFLRKLKIKGKTVSVIGLFSIAFVIAACGFQISAIRAVIAYVILFVGNLIQRKGEGLNSLCVAITLIIAANPFVIGSVSFLLSVSATFGILVLYPMLCVLLGKIKISGKLGKLCNSALDIALVSFSAIICSMPIVVYYFGTISSAAILVNVLILFTVNITLILTAIGLIISVFPLINILSSVVFFIAEIFAEYFMTVIRLFGRIESMVIYVGKEMSIFWFVFAVSIIIFSYLGCKKISNKSKE